MQSQNGDVQLSVRLDTKGIKSDAQKVRDEIQKTVNTRKQNNKVTQKIAPEVDVKEAEETAKKAVDEINKEFKDNKPEVKPEVDTSDLVEKAKEIKTKLIEMSNAGDDGTSTAYTEATHKLIDLMGQFSREESKAYSQWEVDAVTANKHIQEAAEEAARLAEEEQNIANAEEQVTENATSTARAVENQSYSMEQIEQQLDDFRNNTEEAKKAQEEAAKQAAEMAEKTVQSAKYIMQLQQALQDTDRVAEDLAYDLDMFKEGFKYSDDFNRLNSIAQQLEKEFRSGSEELLKMKIAGKDNSTEFQELAIKTAEVGHQLEKVSNIMYDMRDSGAAYVEGINTAEVKNVEKAYDALTNKITMAREEAKRAAEAAKEAQRQEAEEARRAAQAEKEAQQQAAREAKEAEKAEIAAAKAAEQARIEAEKAAAARKKGILNILSGFKKLLPSMNSVKKGLSSMGMSFKQFFGAALGIRGLFALFSKLKSAITDSIKSLAQMNGGNNKVNESLSMLMSSLTQLKNAWGAAFAPILTAVAPLLNNLINMLTRAANAVAQFIAAATGQSTWMRAKQVQQNYAKSLEKTGKAAKEAAGKLAAFDDLNVLGKDNENDDAGGGGAGGLDPNAMFEEVPVDDWFKDLWEKLKEMWANADFTELGAALGQKLKEALDSIDWDAVKEFARKLGKSIATFLNGFFETEGLGESIGKTLAECFNTAFEFLYSFIENFHWDSFGKFIGETLNGIFHTIDWELIAKTLAHGLNGLLTTLSTAVRTTDWHSLTEGITQGLQTMFREIDFSTWTDTISALIIGFGDLICGALDGIDWVSLPTDLWNGLVELWEGIDWDGLGDVISRLLYSAVKAACDLLVGLAELGVLLGDALRASWEKTKNYFAEWTEIAGGDVIKGIFLGILNALASIGMWVREHIFEPIINAFKDAFGISSPSTVMAEQGVFIMEGLFEGIKSLMGAIIEIWNNLKTKVLEVVENLKNKVHEKWENLKTKTKTAWENIKNTVQDKATAMKDKAVTIATTMKTNVSEKWSELKKKGVDTFTALKETVIKIWEAIKEGIKTPINGIISFIESFINGIIWGINKLFEFLNSLQIDIPEWVPEIGGQTMGFDFAYLEPIEIPRLAQGAVIPPNKEFLAMLGDQKNGTNIEAPLDTIKEAFADVVGNLQVQNTGYAEMKLDGETVARLLVPYVISELNRRGYDLKLIGA